MTKAPNADSLLRAAIADRRLVAFSLKGCSRIAEPHDYGVIGGVHKLFFYQVGGESNSTPATGWRWATVSEIDDLQITEHRFPGSRPAPSGRHIRWDELFASVSKRG